MIRLASLVAMCVSGAVLWAGDSGQISVQVMDNYGNSVKAPIISLENDGNIVQLSQDGSTVVPYGNYKLTVVVPGFKKTLLNITVNQPRQMLSVALQLGGVEGPTPGCSVYGRIYPDGSATRVRAMQMFGTMLADVAVDSQGSYAIQGLECGDYMLMVFGPKGCISVKYPRFTRDARIDFHLPREVSADCATSK